MAIVDIIILVVLAIFAAIGLFRGFFKSLIGLIGNFGCFLLAYFTASPVAVFFNKFTHLNSALSKALNGKITSVLPVFDTPLTKQEVIATIDGNGGSAKYLKSFISDQTFNNTAELGIQVSNTLGVLLSIVITGIIIFILTKLLLLLLNKLINKITANSTIALGLDKTLGFFIGALRGALVIFVCMVIIYLLKGLPFLNTVVDNIITNSTIAKWMWVNTASIMQFILEKINFNQWISDVFVP